MEKTPWHIWVVGVLTLLWNSMGAWDYIATQYRVEAYMKAFTPEQLDYFYSFPTWVVAAWAIAIWFAVIASILILMRSALAVPVMWISFVAMVLTSIHNFILADVKMSDIMGREAMIFSAVIFIVTVLLVRYVTVQKRLGRLR